MGRGGRWKRKRFTWLTSPHWREDPAHCVDGTLLMMVHSSAAQLTGGKLDATLCWGVVIHTTICSGGRKCHALRGAGASSLVSLVVY